MWAGVYAEEEIAYWREAVLLGCAPGPELEEEKYAAENRYPLFHTTIHR
jgi:hypothetical protein